MFFRCPWEAGLDGVPLSVRRKLVLAGLRIPGRAWRAMSEAQRLALAHLPAETADELQAFTTVVQAFSPEVRERRPLARSLWAPLTMPVQVRERLGGNLSDSDWSSLSEDARYALYRLARLRTRTPRFEELARVAFGAVTPSRTAAPPTLQ